MWYKIARRRRPRRNPRSIRPHPHPLSRRDQRESKRSTPATSPCVMEEVSTSVLQAPRHFCVRLWLAPSSVEWLCEAPSTRRRRTRGRPRVGVVHYRQVRRLVPIPRRWIRSSPTRWPSDRFLPDTPIRTAAAAMALDTLLRRSGQRCVRSFFSTVASSGVRFSIFF